MAKKSKSFRKAHFLLLLLIFITLSVAIYLLKAPQRTGSSVARTNYTTCSNANSPLINCSVSTPVNGNTLVAVIGTRGTTANRVSSISQSGATWVRATQAINNNGNTTEIWYTTSLTSASTIITINLAESINASAIITQYSGILTTGKLDKTANNTGSSSNADTGTTTTTSQSNQLWVGGLTVSDIGSFANPNNNFTKIAESASTGGTNNSRNNSVYLEKIVTSTGQATTSSGINSTQWSGAIATFNASGPPTQIAFVNEPFTIVAGACSNAITIETRDSSGAPVFATNDVIIQISTLSNNSKATFYTSPNCSESSLTAFTFSGGESSKTFYMKDNFAGSNLSLLATKISGSDTLTDATLNYTTTAGTMSKIGIRMPGQTLPYQNGKAAGAPTSQTAGSSFSITELRALDDNDNTVTNYSGTKIITYSGPGSSPNNTTPLYTTSVSFSNGISTTNLVTTLYKAESNLTLIATENGQYASPTPAFSVVGGALSTYVFSMSNANVIAGTCSSNYIDISATDTYGNARATDSSTILLTTNALGITFYPTSNCVNAQSSFVLTNGAVRIYWKPVKKASGVIITATKNGDTPTGSFSGISISPGAPQTLLVRLPGQSFVDGSGITGTYNFSGLRSPNATAGTSFDVTLYAVDAYNNLVDSGPSNFSGYKTISWSNSVAGNAPNGIAPIYPTTNVSFNNGTSANLLSATYYNAITNRNIRADATSPSLAGTASSNFLVQASATNKYGLSVASNQKAGVAFNIIISALDIFNNELGSLYSAPSGSYVWSTTASSSPDGTAPTIGTLSQGDFVNGKVTKAVTLYKAQSVTFYVSEPSPSTINGTTGTITVDHGDISAHINDSTVVGNPTGFDSRAETITITLRDTWWNPIANFSKANITMSGTGSPSIEQPVYDTDSNGRTTALVTWIKVGNYLVQVAISNAKLVQNDGFTLDADGYLDSTQAISISLNHPSTTLQGGTKIIGGTRIQ